MPRQRGPKTRRLEFTLFKEGDPVLAELDREATARGISLQQHIYDLLRSRYLAQRGQDYNVLLWTPGIPASEPAAPPNEPPSAAGAAADAWLDMLDE